jgi:hypothetical protein
MLIGMSTLGLACATGIAVFVPETESTKALVTTCTHGWMMAMGAAVTYLAKVKGVGS